MPERAADQSHPPELLGRRVIEVCPDCEGEGRLWGVDEEASTHWAERCKLCNCVGYILDMPVDAPNLDQEDIPF
ncbi:hypothetical protein [Rubinisphaera brasiliensis]|uniref:Uncharacterized protein n=1 Tax=Rubinisphaera brasiliensis (strain ATCC 49424 / DSM 5305 / JCM 21570 / IAM 15109 / NBRC 103401 / IFAM 1448) TaxID=756272 RepID=F0SLP5_RUBBR|nr:hypothetical protein [Rubinisphaera brasiliensis]ADY58786.1 hypothetical protein Plabr_1170 [Rubinisphaera brasiliensis DSM 5305]